LLHNIDKPTVLYIYILHTQLGGIWWRVFYHSFTGISSHWCILRCVSLKWVLKQIIFTYWQLHPSLL